jgi:SDR family mycofactocin-dependent oxidoreductase
MTGRVAGKVAFVTGAARGQGRSHAVRLAQEGADIIAVDICQPFSDSPAPPATPEDLAETADLVKAQNRRIVTAEVDVRVYDAVKDAVDSGVEQLGGLDIIVANAGIGTVGTRLDRMKEDVWQEMIDVNLSGVWKSVKAGVPHLLAGGRGGSIILTSSVAGLKTYPHTGHYVAGQTWCGRADADLRRRARRAVHPRQLRASDPREHATVAQREDIPDVSARAGKSWPDDMAPVCQSFHILPIPWVTAEDISNAVLFLASDEARYITGVALPVDAGSCLK